MKKIYQILIHLFVLLLLSTSEIFAQSVKDTTTSESSKIVVVVKNDGTQFIGKILSQDAREVLIETKKMGQVIIPKHEIKEIRELKDSDLSSTGEYLPSEIFSTRYFITTNGLPINKGESYIQWNWFGPDFQFGVGKNFGLGVMTSWFAVPIIGTAKYSIPLADKVNIGIGTLLGTGSWSIPDFGLALPFGTLTFGDRKKNITFSGGYGEIFYKETSYDNSGLNISKRVNEGRILFSVAGMAKVGKKISIVFDSFIMPEGSSKTYRKELYNNTTNTYDTYYDNQPAFALIIPGIRWQFEGDKAFQFGFAGLSFDGEFVPMPIPMVQWYRKL